MFSTNSKEKRCSCSPCTTLTWIFVFWLGVRSYTLNYPSFLYIRSKSGQNRNPYWLIKSPASGGIDRQMEVDS